MPLVVRLAGERLINLFDFLGIVIIKFHLLESGTTSFIRANRISQAAFTEKSVSNIIFFSWIVIVRCFPAKFGVIRLAIHGEASFSVVLSMILVRVPAKLVVLALIVCVADFVLASYFGARGGEWPAPAFTAVHTHVTVFILGARLILLASQAHVFSDVAELRIALEHIVAVSTRQVLLIPRFHFLAVSVNFLTFNQGHIFRNITVRPAILDIQ